MPTKKVDKSSTNPSTEKDRNKTWTENHLAIKNAYLDLVKENKKAPTIREVAAKSGLSNLTIQRHINELKFEPSMMVERVLTKEVVLSLFQATQKKSVRAIEAWFRVIEGHSDKIEVKHQVITVSVQEPKKEA